MLRSRLQARKGQKKLKAYSLMELGLTLGIIAALLAVLFVVYKTYNRNALISKARSYTLSLITAITNLGTPGEFPAVSTTDISTDASISPYLPQDKSTYKNVSYDLPAGDDSTITIKIPNYKFSTDPTTAKEVCMVVADTINRAYKGKWNADKTTCASGYLTLTRPHSNCQ